MDKYLLANKGSLPKGVTLKEVEEKLKNGDAKSLKDKTSDFVECVNSTIYEAFINFLVMTFRAERTAISYADKVKDACEQCDINMMSLFYESEYTVDDLINMYSSSGMMAYENKRQRYAPRTALKAFEDFVIYERDY